jgi:hypothetical protein
MDLWFSSSVYVEGDIEIRVYNDSISGEVKNIPEICVRRDGMSTSNTPPPPFSRPLLLSLSLQSSKRSWFIPFGIILPLVIIIYGSVA